MADNQINIYQENSRTLTCPVSSSNVSLANHETYLVVKETKSGDQVFSATGSLTLYSGSWTGSYIIDSTDTAITPKVYFFEIVAESGSLSKHTLVLDNFVVQDSVLY